MCPLDQFVRIITAMDEVAIKHRINISKKQQAQKDGRRSQSRRSSR